MMGNDTFSAGLSRWVEQAGQDVRISLRLLIKDAAFTRAQRRTNNGPPGDARVPRRPSAPFSCSSIEYRTTRSPSSI